jgi:hypothetical protein
MAVCNSCGNTIPQWAQGGCPSCSMIARDRMRSGRAGPKELRRRQKLPQPIVRKITEKKIAHVGSKKDRNIPDSYIKFPRPLLCGFNLLLQYIYGRRIQLYEILSDLGITQNKVTMWCKDETWLLKFIGRLESALLDVLIDTDLNNNPSILLEYYLADCSVGNMAMKYKSTTSEVLRVLNRYRLYLRSDEGRSAFEEIVLKCVEE